jgi:hypothetical protein
LVFVRVLIVLYSIGSCMCSYCTVFNWFLYVFLWYCILLVLVRVLMVLYSIGSCTCCYVTVFYWFLYVFLWYCILLFLVRILMVLYSIGSCTCCYGTVFYWFLYVFLWYWILLFLVRVVIVLYSFGYSMCYYGTVFSLNPKQIAHTAHLQNNFNYGIKSNEINQVFFTNVMFYSLLWSRISKNNKHKIQYNKITYKNQ